MFTFKNVINYYDNVKMLNILEVTSLEKSTLRVPECLSQEPLIKFKAYRVNENFSLYRKKMVWGIFVTFLKKIK